MLNLEELNTKTRETMLNELNLEIASESGTYLSKRLSKTGRDVFPTILKNAIKNGDEQTLEQDLLKPIYWSDSWSRQDGMKVAIQQLAPIRIPYMVHERDSTETNR